MSDAIGELSKTITNLLGEKEKLLTIIDGMRRVCAIARMINEQRPDVRMTHALNSYDIKDANTQDLRNEKILKLKRLLLLVDESVSGAQMNDLTHRQWTEFVKCFPDEA